MHLGAAGASEPPCELVDCPGPTFELQNISETAIDLRSGTHKLTCFQWTSNALSTGGSLV